MLRPSPENPPAHALDFELFQSVMFEKIFPSLVDSVNKRFGSKLIALLTIDGLSFLDLLGDFPIWDLHKALTRLERSSK